MTKIYWALIATILVSFNPTAQASVWDYVPGMGGAATPAAQPPTAKAEAQEDDDAVPETTVGTTPSEQPSAATAVEHDDADDADDSEEPEAEE